MLAVGQTSENIGQGLAFAFGQVLAQIADFLRGLAELILELAGLFLHLAGFAQHVCDQYGQLFLAAVRIDAIGKILKGMGFPHRNRKSVRKATTGFPA